MSKGEASMVVRTGLFSAAILGASLSLPALLLMSAPGYAQAPAASGPSSIQPKPVTGFVSQYEILRTVRSAGFHPLSSPLRDGTIYVLRATDFRGILMRVVVDARTGVIRDVTRIVSARPSLNGIAPEPSGPSPYAAPVYGPPGYGSRGYGPPPYGPPPYEPPGYGPPPYGPPPYGPLPYGAPVESEAPPPQMGPAQTGPERLAPSSRLSEPDMLSPPPIRRSTAHAAFPPLPRPRPTLSSSTKAGQPSKISNPGKPAPAANASADAQPLGSANTKGVGASPGSALSPSGAAGKASSVPPLND